MEDVTPIRPKYIDDLHAVRDRHARRLPENPTTSHHAIAVNRLRRRIADIDELIETFHECIDDQRPLPAEFARRAIALSGKVAREQSTPADVIALPER